MRQFIKIGKVRLEPDRIVSYEAIELDKMNYGIHFYYDGEFEDFRGMMDTWFGTAQERNDVLTNLDELFL